MRLKGLDPRPHGCGDGYEYDVNPPGHCCHGSAGTPLGTHANGEDSGLEESCKTIRT
jgi:hypothetical protein